MPPRAALLAALALAFALGACAARAPRTPLPESEDYVFPSWPAAALGPEEAQRIERAWRRVMEGDVLGAERDLQKMLRRRPGLVPAQTALAYARLRGGRLEAAEAAFASALSVQPDYVPALVGSASVFRRRGDPESALERLRRAAAAAPDERTVRRRLAEARLQVTERRVGAARAALESGDAEGAIVEYRRALETAPEVSGLRLELARLLEERGDPEGALSVLEADPQPDRAVLLERGRLRVDLGQHERALEVYRELLARDPADAEAQRATDRAREALEMLRMPEEYRQIREAPRVSRSELAALVALKVTALARAGTGQPKVAVDIAGSWAREHIIRVLALDIMDVYPNHTFQPGATVRRGELARAAARVLDLLGWPSASPPAIRDMSRAHLHHDAAARVVAAGLMELTEDGGFEPWRPVTGEEAAAVVDALARLVGP